MPFGDACSDSQGGNGAEQISRSHLLWRMRNKAIWKCMCKIQGKGAQPVMRKVLIHSISLHVEMMWNVKQGNWHERAAFQRSVFGRLTAGNDVVATIFIRLFFFLSFFPVFFLFFFFSVATFSHKRSARIKELI